MDANLRFRTDRVWSANSVSNQETISLSYFRGSANFTVFSRNSNNREPVLRVALTPEAAVYLRQNIINIIGAAPGQRISLERSSYNMSTKSSTIESTIVLSKDDKHIISMEVTGRDGMPLKFPIKAPTTLTVNGGVPDEETRSKTKITVLLDALKDDMTLRLLSSFNTEKPTYGNNNGGNNNYSKGNNTKKSNPDKWEDDELTF